MSKDLQALHERCTFVCRLFFSNKYFLLLLAAFVLVFYWFGVRPVSVVQNCHASAEQNAKVMIQQRLRLDPKNAQLLRAAQAGMLVDEDYTSAYRNCLRSQGYDLK